MASRDPDRLAPSKILVVDDNEANRFLAKETLEDEGHTVVLATGGLEALRLFEQERPDCVLLDVRMPDLDGFQVCEKLRAMPEGKDTPIIFLTALRDVDTFDRALRVGGDDFLNKPIHPAELVVRVETSLKLRQLRTSLRTHYELFKQQRDALLRLQLEKERVIAFVVHDLKNPVNTVDLNAQLLLRDRSLPALVHDAAHQIRAASRQLGRMILNLLDVAKADQGQLAPRPASQQLESIVDAVRDELRVAASAREVILATKLTVPNLFADEELLRRVLANLVENAIRYSSRGGEITIASQRGSGGVEIRVSDQGRGVPPEMREKVFQPFTQVDDGGPASSRDNRGLGLAFCKRALEAHGGRISIEDANPGACFVAFFPDGS